MMVLFGRVYGGIIAAVIIGATIWFDLSPTWSFLVLGLSLLVLGLAREILVKWIALAEQQVSTWLSRVWTQSKSTIRARLDHGAGA